MAYDNPALKMEHKSRMLWATRLSVLSPGNNFPETRPTLAGVGVGVLAASRANWKS